MGPVAAARTRRLARRDRHHIPRDRYGAAIPARLATRLTLVALVVLVIAGTIGVFRARSFSSSDELLARARAFVAAHPTAKFRGTTSVKGGNVRSPVGNAQTVLAQVGGELQAPGRAHVVIADDDGATELVLASRAVYVRDADARAELTDARYARADAQASRIMHVRVEQAKTFDVANVLAAATNAKTLARHGTTTTLDADVIPAALFGRAASRHVQWATLRAVVRDDGTIDRVQLLTRAEASMLTRVVFSDWGNTAIQIAAPAADQVDTAPPVAQANLAAFKSTPLLMPRTLPAGWKLVRAGVLPADDTQEGCAQAELAYEDEASAHVGYLYLYELPKSCTAPPAGETTPFTAGNYTGFSSSDEGPYVQITVGRTTVQAVSDLPLPRLAATLSELVPLALQSA